MPNIEIRGFEKYKAENLKRAIDRAMQGIGLQHDAVTSVMPMEVTTCDGRSIKTPYLRVCSTETAEIRMILDALRSAGVREDVEYLVLDGFIPASKMG